MTIRQTFHMRPSCGRCELAWNRLSECLSSSLKPYIRHEKGSGFIPYFVYDTVIPHYEPVICFRNAARPQANHLSGSSA
jgi:hypothetical protein